MLLHNNGAMQPEICFHPSMQNKMPQGYYSRCKLLLHVKLDFICQLIGPAIFAVSGHFYSFTPSKIVASKVLILFLFVSELPVIVHS